MIKARRANAGLASHEVIPLPVPLASVDELRAAGAAHVCQFYEDRQELMAAKVAVAAGALARHEAFLCSLDETSVDDLCLALAHAGVDVSRALATGALTFMRPEELLEPDGRFDPKQRLEFVRAKARAALADGFTGFCGSGEMGWVVDTPDGAARLIEFEAGCNAFFDPSERVMFLCQYEHQRCSSPLLHALLRSHPQTVIDDSASCNLYFEPPPVFTRPPDDPVTVDWMLQQLRLFRDTLVTLEQAVQTRDDFLSIASHELNTPLTSLLLQSQVLRDAIGASLDTATLGERVRRAVDVTDRQLRRLATLVHNLLDLSRINLARIRLDREWVDLDEIVTTASTRMKPQLDRMGTKVELATRPAIGLWDRSRVEEIVENLLSNAARFGAGRAIHVDVGVRGGVARLTVSDEGPGVPPGDRERIFERFERGEGQMGGLGLGLYISREIARAHGGDIIVGDTMVGATFIVELPLQG